MRQCLSTKAGQVQLPAGRRSTAGAVRSIRRRSSEQRVEHDLFYIENWSVMFDLYILAPDALPAAQLGERLLSAVDAAGGRRPQGLPVSAFGHAVLWFAVFLGGFVFFEPAPYELFLALADPRLGALRSDDAARDRAAAHPDAGLPRRRRSCRRPRPRTSARSRSITPSPAFLAFSSCFFAAVLGTNPRLYASMSTPGSSALPDGGARRDRLFRAVGRALHQVRPRHRRLPGPERFRPVPRLPLRRSSSAAS